ncbi:hypothetical protein B296_00050470 [Ensete ventricosum]|uniref:Sodium/calcium exchanger membrane region domain-containing protein n=1 Tax=Ensete ventricosum TaxID=4639 RepID=A0A426XFF0_ENSVE|nr:hypothetical protein B296_00050470 [Ensete ventricosum]
MASTGYEAARRLEAGNNPKGGAGSRTAHGHGRTAHNMSSSSLRKKSDLSLVSKVRCGLLRAVLTNLQEIFLGTKLFILFPAIPLAIAANYLHFGRAWLFALSLLGLTPLAERVSFLTELIGGLLNATCGNATELIIALFALHRGKIEVVKCSLVGSILSNLLLVLGSSLFLGGIANLHKEQSFDRVSTEVEAIPRCCHLLRPSHHDLRLGAAPRRSKLISGEHAADASPRLGLSRACSIVMLLAYVAYLFFQLKTHRQLFESEEVSVNTPNPFQPKPNELEMVFSSDEQEEDDDNDDAVAQDEAVIGLPTALAWLLGMTAVIAILSEYVVGTIEVPLSVIVAWIMGIKMDLDLELLETGSLIMAILITAFTLQVYTLLWITYTLRS